MHNRWTVLKGPFVIAKTDQLNLNEFTTDM